MIGGEDNDKIFRGNAHPSARKESGGTPAPGDVGAATNFGGRPPHRHGGRLLDRLTSEERKTYPMCTGLLDYFPDALAEVSHISWLGNQKHNPGMPLHWSREKSADHPDCVVRHMATRTEMDTPAPGVKIMHMAEAVWRALADLQVTLEERDGLSLPPGAVPPK